MPTPVAFGIKTAQNLFKVKQGAKSAAKKLRKKKEEKEKPLRLMKRGK